MPIPLNPVQLTKLITNALIIGGVTETKDGIIIKSPYEAIPTQDGVQIIPYDEHILGQKVEEIHFDKSLIVYSLEPGSELKNLYLTQISGIIIPKPGLIL